MKLTKKKKRRYNTVGPKDLGTPAHFISSSRSIPRKKKYPRTNKGNPDY